MCLNYYRFPLKKHWNMKKEFDIKKYEKRGKYDVRNLSS